MQIINRFFFTQTIIHKFDKLCVLSLIPCEGSSSAPPESLSGPQPSAQMGAWFSAETVRTTLKFLYKRPEEISGFIVCVNTGHTWSPWSNVVRSGIFAKIESLRFIYLFYFSIYLHFLAFYAF